MAPWLLCLLGYVLGCLVLSLLAGMLDSIGHDQNEVMVIILWPVVLVAGAVVLPGIGAYKLGVWIRERREKRPAEGDEHG